MEKTVKDILRGRECQRERMARNRWIDVSFPGEDEHGGCHHPPAPPFSLLHLDRVLWGLHSWTSPAPLTPSSHCSSGTNWLEWITDNPTDRPQYVRLGGCRSNTVRVQESTGNRSRSLSHDATPTICFSTQPRQGRWWWSVGDPDCTQSQSSQKGTVSSVAHVQTPGYAAGW